MTIYIDINKIENDTLSKLTWTEIGALGLNNAGIFTYKGLLKSKRSGFKTILKENGNRLYEDENYIYYFVKIIPTDENEHYAFRLYNKNIDSYVNTSILEAIDFFK